MLLEPLIQHVFYPFLCLPLGSPHILALLASCCCDPSFVFISHCSNLLFKSWSLIYISLFLYPTSKALIYAFSIHSERQVQFKKKKERFSCDTFSGSFFVLQHFQCNLIFSLASLLPWGFDFLLAKKDNLGEDVMQLDN